MKIVHATQAGDASVLALSEVARPVPQAGEVLLKVAAAGVNYADIQQRRNTYFLPSTYPKPLGYEVAGTIAEFGPGLPGQAAPAHLHVGQRAMGMVPEGGYAEYAIVPAAQLIPLPEHMPFAEATALLVQGMTGVGLLRAGTHSAENEAVLVLAASGGVGSILVQLARAQGKTVIAAVGSDDKKDAALALGAHHTVNYADADWTEQVQRAVGGKGVSLLLDATGGHVAAQAMGLLAQGGTAIVYGASSGQPTMVAGQSFIGGSGKTLKGYTLFDDLPNAPEFLGELFGHLQSGTLKLQVQPFAFADVQRAHQAIEDRQTQGKVVLVME